MERIAMLNNKGVTLIEMMISLVIVMIVSLALMQTALVGMNMNVRNSMRDEAVNVAEGRINELRSLPFTEKLTSGDLAAGVMVLPAVSKNLRSTTIDYIPTQTIADIKTAFEIEANAKQITISVDWTYRGNSYTHSVTSIMRRQR